MGNIVAYHHYLDSKEENTILHEAAQLNKELGQTQGQITQSWIAKYNRVCKTVNSPNATNAPFISTSRKPAIQSLQNLYTRHWHTFSEEDYPDLKDRHLRTAMIRLRISAHNLLIERGRYSRSPLAVEERTCPVLHMARLRMSCIL